MLEVLIAGLSTGLFLGLLPGGVVFSIVHNSINGGWKKGVYIAMGVSISDILFMWSILFATSYINSLERFHFEIALIGGLILLAMGIGSIYNGFYKLKSIEPKLMKSHNLILNGFLLNTFNPVNFFMWSGITAAITTTGQYDRFESFIYFGCCLFSIFLAESLLSVFSAKIPKYLTQDRLSRLNIYMGLLFIGISVKIFFDAVTKFY